MARPIRLLAGAVVCTAALLAALPAAAQIEDQLEAYTGANAEGYLQPLADALGANLNSGIFTSAYIPPDGFHFKFSVEVMSVFFGDDDRTFTGAWEEGFEPLDPDAIIDVPTVVGDGGVRIIEGEGGTSFAFPGGFDLNSFSVGVPQFTIGSLRGTEAIIRYVAFDFGDVELGNLSLLGLGVRHSISQYMGDDPPLDLAVGLMWHDFKLGENSAGGDLIAAGALTVGVQASKRFGSGAILFEPYAGLSYDNFSMDVEYESEATGIPLDVSLDLESDPTARLTVGACLSLGWWTLNAEYAFAGQSGLAFGSGIAF